MSVYGPLLFALLPALGGIAAVVTSIFREYSRRAPGLPPTPPQFLADRIADGEVTADRITVGGAQEPAVVAVEQPTPGHWEQPKYSTITSSADRCAGSAAPSPTYDHIRR